MITHEDLVQLAAKWLQKRCPIVITELVAGCGEVPDAIGFASWETILIECKTSRADFLADKKKMWRRSPEMGLGRRRYFFAEKGLIKTDELPNGWGLLEFSPERKAVYTERASGEHEFDFNQERKILLSCLRRLGAQDSPGVSIKRYTYQTKNTATIGVEEDLDNLICKGIAKGIVKAFKESEQNK